MADLSEVEQALADAATTALYPFGPLESSIIGVACRVYRGWPSSAGLNADLNAGLVNISISSDAESGKTTTRYIEEWQYQPTASSLVATSSGSTIHIAGTPAVGDVIGAMVDGLAFAYRVMSGDTPTLVAANLCALIRLRRIASVRGACINIPGSHSIVIRVVSDGRSSCEGRRQEKDIRVILWCPTPTIRDSVAGAVDLALSQSSFLALPDATRARVTYKNTSSYDQSQNALLYRRDLVYCIEYPTVISAALPSMLFGAALINDHITFG